MKFCKKNAKRNKRSIPKVFKGKPYPPRIKLTLTVKSWTDALWDCRTKASRTLSWLGERRKKGAKTAKNANGFAWNCMIFA